VAIRVAPAFLVNDPEHAPFGWGLLRGITPARLAIVALACVCISTGAASFALMRGAGLGEAALQFVMHWSRNFLGALPVFVLIVKVDRWSAEWSRSRRALALACAVVAGAWLFAFIRWAASVPYGVMLDRPGYWMAVVGQVFRVLVLGGAMTAILFIASEERRAARAAHRERLARADIEKQITEARLHLLQAQIEPHFLFNSLASVKRLYDTEVGGGRLLLANLIRYIEAVRSRPDESALRDEVALAQAYLGIVGVRMGHRLAVDMDISAEAQCASIPPFMLGTLVENAVKHGVAPRASGGHVRIEARRRGDELEVRVADDGVGFRPGSGTGVGLANTRARLATLFGERARLELEANSGAGVTATIAVPYRETVE
jgi:hypothetical protein